MTNADSSTFNPSKYMNIFTTRADREDTSTWDEEGKKSYDDGLLFKSNHYSKFSIDNNLQEFRNQVEHSWNRPKLKIESGIGRKLNEENIFSYLHLNERPCTQKGETYGPAYEELLADYLSKIYHNSLQQAQSKDISDVIFMLHGSTDFLYTPIGFTNESIANADSFNYIAKKTDIPNLQIYTFQHMQGYLAFDVLRGGFWETSHNNDFPATRHILEELEKFNLKIK
jgi:hypothetical protein